MSPIDTACRHKQEAQSWRVLRPVTIIVSDAEYAAIEALLGREPRYLPDLAAFLTAPSALEGTKSGDNPTPG